MKKLSRREFIRICSGTAASLGLAGSAWATARITDVIPTPPDLPLPSTGSFLRFDELTLFNHQNFQGLHDFSFAPARTEIIGPNGSGKSTIADLLASGEPTENGTSNVHVRASPQGCESLLHRYRDLIHVGSQHTLRDTILKRIHDRGTDAALQQRAIGYFRRMVRNAGTVLNRHDLSAVLQGGCTGSGGQIAAAYAFLFAERDTVNYRLPLVLDDPFGAMDSELRHAFSALVAPLETQIILLTTEDRLKASGWPGWHVLNEKPDGNIDRLPSMFGHFTKQELRRALHLSGSCNRYFLA